MGNKMTTVVSTDHVNIVHWGKLQVLQMLMDVKCAHQGLTALMVTVPPLRARLVITALLVAPLRLFV